MRISQQQDCGSWENNMDQHWREKCLRAQIPLQLNLSNSGTQHLPWPEFYQLQSALQHLKSGRDSLDDTQNLDFTGVTKLDMSAHKSLADSALAALIKRLSNLHELNLQGCALAGPLTLRAITQLSRLRELNIERCTLFSSALLLKHLKSTSLSKLVLSDHSLDDALWKELSNRPLKQLHLLRMDWNLSSSKVDVERLDRLEKLELSRCRGPHPEFLKHLIVQLPKLKEFRARHCSNISEQLLLVLPRSLTHLDLTWCESLKMSTLNAISSRFAHLKSLKLSQCQLVTNEFLEKLSQLQHLTSLDVAHCKLITKEGLVNFLQKSPRLRFFNFEGCATHFSIATALAQHTHLEHLVLPCDFQVSWLDKCSFQQLHCLHLRDNQSLENKGLADLAALLSGSRVHCLDISGSCFTDWGLEALANVGGLRSLYIGGRIGSPLSISKDALKQLGNWQQLQKLQIALSESVCRQTLEVLLRGPAPLKILELGPNPNLTLQDLEYLISSHPLLQIEHYGYSDLPSILKDLLFTSKTKGV